MNKIITANFILISTVIGIGIFALPYTFLQSGLWFIFWLFFWIFGFSFLYYLYANLLSQAEQVENFPGILAEFLHQKARIFGWFLDLISYGIVLLIYFLVAGEFLSLIFPEFSFQQARLIFALVSFFIGILALLKFAKLESILSILMIVFTIILSFYFLFLKESVNINFSNNPLFAYGSIIFAYAGLSIVPILYDLLKSKKKIFQVSLLSYSIIALLYLFFSFSVVNFFGNTINDLSLRSFVEVLPENFLILLIILVLINILTTAASMIFYLKRGLENEFYLKNWQANLFLLVWVIFLAFLPKFNFISLVNLVGEVFLGLEFLLLVIIAYRITNSRLEKIFSLILGLLLVIGLVYAI